MTLLDILIVAVYLLLVSAIGIWCGRKEGNTRDFFVGNRQIPWMAVLLSIVATEISAATFLSVPATGFKENLNYLQFALGSVCARFAIAFLFIGVFYKLDCVTVYEYLAKRFGNQTRYTAAIFYFFSCILGAGVRLLIAAIGLSVIMGWPLHWTIILFAACAILYTAFGGIKAIVWTDVLQAIVFVGGGIAAFVFILSKIPGGFTEMMDIAERAGRLDLFRWAPVVQEGQSVWQAWLGDANIFWLAFLNAFVTTFASFGTNQDMTQRMLTCKNASLSKRALILSGFLSLPVIVLFLFVGIAIFAYYRIAPDPNMGMVIDRHDQIFPYFIKTVMPAGLRGLLLVGVLAAAMSSLDSALGALSSSVVVDLYKPLLKKNASEAHYLRVSRWNVVFFGTFLGVTAWLFRDNQGFLWLCYKVVSITYGALLGIFLLGVTTKRGSNPANLFAMISSAVLCTFSLYLIETKTLNLGWSWLILLGTVWTYGIGYLGAIFFEKRE